MKANVPTPHNFSIFIFILMLIIIPQQLLADYFQNGCWWMTNGSSDYKYRADGTIVIQSLDGVFWSSQMYDAKIYYRINNTWKILAWYGERVNSSGSYFAGGILGWFGGGNHEVKTYDNCKYSRNYFHGSWRMIELLFTPPDQLKGKDIELKIVTDYQGGGGTFYKTAKSFRPPAPTGVRASADQYNDKVKIEWNNPTVIYTNIDRQYNWWVDVYRNGAYLGNGGQNGYFEDRTAVHGVNYNYKVVTVNDASYNTSVFTAKASGRRWKAKPPRDVKVSMDQYCNKVKLEWSSPSLGEFDGQKWSIEVLRNNQLIKNVGQNNSFEDVTAERGVTYHYKLRTKFESSGLHYSDDTPVADGRVTDRIAAPTSIKASKENCNLVDLSWRWDGDPPDSYGIMQADQPPKSIRCDGAGDYVKAPAINLGGEEITIEYWFKGTSLQSAVRQQEGINYIVAGWNGKHILSNDGGTSGGVSVGAKATDGRWHHVAVTWKSSAINGFVSYLDGEIVQKRKSNTSTLPKMGANVYLGAYQGASEFINGNIDEIRIWNKARTQSEIQETMSRSLTGNEAGLVAYWRINDNAIVAKDFSAAGYDGTITGATLNDELAPVFTISDIPGSETDYVFTNLPPNKTFYYAICAKDECGGWGMISTPVEGKTTLDIGQPKNLIVSKGYHSDKVELKWECDGSVDRFKIWRSVAGENKPVHIVTLNEGTYTYNDMSAVPGIIYEYTIKGERNCDKLVATSDAAIELGFREAAGTVTGHVEFEGGNSVQDVEVFVEPTIGNCLKFDGVNDYVTIPGEVFAEIDREVTIELWAKRDSESNKEMKLFEGLNSQNKPAISISMPDKDGNVVWSAGANNNIIDYISQKPDAVYKPGEWNHWVFVKDINTGEMKIYLNGKLWHSATQKKNSMGGVSNIRLCSAGVGGSYWGGWIDEVRIWNIARKAGDIARDYRRMLIGDEDNLVAYWRLDENIGSKLFDRSKTVERGTATYHGLDAIISGAEWSALVPAVADLHLSGYSDANGNYEIRGIRYVGDGQTYTITPNYGVHKFQPGSRSAFISANSSVINSVDFLDISTFEVRGKVKYENTSCYAKDIFILVDGDHTNPPTQTDQNGEFVMNIPIGRHRLSAYAPNHEFSPGVWPPESQPPHNFIQPITLDPFIDITKPTAIGRVVGGWREAEAFPGKHKNNIGQAKLTLESQNGCIKRVYETDATTGGFTINDLPPLKYNAIVEMKSGVGQTTYGFDTRLLDMSINAPLQTEADTSVKNNNNNALSLMQAGSAVDLSEPIVDLVDEWTLEGWFKFPLAIMESWNTLFCGSNNDRQLTIKRSSNELGYFDGSSGEFISSNYDFSKLTTGWHHIAVVAKKTDSKQSYYIDGELVGSVARKSTSNIKRIGNSIINAEAFGVIDELRIWNIARTQTDIQQAMKIILTGAETGLELYYRCETGSELTVTDQSSKKHDGILTANSYWTSTDKLEQFPAGGVVNYNYQLDFVYNAGPQMDFVGLPENETCQQLPFPVFEQDNKYKIRIALFEQYTNFDKPEADPTRLDNVPVKEALLTINNDIGDEAEKKIQMNNNINPDTNTRYPLGDTLYTFKAGNPNFLVDQTTPEYSYTKTFDVSASLKSGRSVSKLIRGYVLGARARENNFVTRGPERVEMILRDPPGSGSSAFKSEGSTQSYSMSMEINASLGYKIENNVSLGPDFMAGLGVITEVDVTMDFTKSTEITFSATSQAELNKTITFTKTFSTSDDAGAVGADADVFIGGSENYLYGMTDILKLDDDCTLLKTAGMFLVPKGFATTFIYTADHIKNYLIPDLEMLRNNLFTRSEYVSKVSPDDPMYGSNNDDTRWGDLVTSSTPTITETNKDLDGPSYQFVEPLHYTGIADSVRWYNQQIRLWREALSMNDKLKANAIFVENISFDANANYEQEVSHEVSSSFTQSFELGINNEIGTKLGVEHDGIGAETTMTLSMGLSIGASLGLGETKTVTTGFALSDGDEGDYFSIDVCHDPVYATPVFKTVAGQSMCPWEGPTYWMKDFNKEPGESPNNIQISSGTMHREMPVLKVYPTVVENVPPDQPAVFNIQLGNASETDEPMTYYLSVMQETNPYGAVVAVNGVIIENYMQYTIDAGATLNNTLTIMRGPEQFEYENIKLAFYSPCQGDISDDISVTAKFIRECTPVSIYTPIENWVVNSFCTSPSGKDTLLIKLFDYDIHDLFLKYLKLQYRPLDGNTWYTIQQYNKAEWVPVANVPGLFTSGTEPPYIPGNFPTWADSLPDGYELPSNEPFILYTWDVSQLPDKQYQIRAISNCELVENKSEPITGILDRIKPHAFGTPEPRDGVLSPGDDIILTLNEAVQSSPGVLTFDNFDIRAVLNGTKIDHSTSLYFDGVDDYAAALDNFSYDMANLSIEAWVNTQSTGGWQTILMKGNYGYGLALDENMKLRFWNQSTKDNTSASEVAVPENEWTHVAVTTDGSQLSYYINGAPAGTSIKAQVLNNNGDLYIGRSGEAGNVDNFKGFIHELRLWSTVQTRTDIASKMGYILNGNEAGLVSYFAMDEGLGDLIEDKANDHHASINQGTWKVYPIGKAIEMAGNAVVIDTMHEVSMDNYTVEFWYRPTTSSFVPVFTVNGAGEHEIKFSINDANLTCHFNNEVSDDLWNANVPISANAWQHIALTWNGLKGKLYKNGVVVAETADSVVFDYFSDMVIGDSSFTGSFDEVRIWRLARTQSQIQRYYAHRLTGQEPGLVAYLPFEKHNAQLVAETTLNDLSSYWGYESTDNSGCGCWKWIENKNHAQAVGSIEFIDDTPNVQIPRPVQPVAFEWSVRDNQIYINLLTPDSLIENCQLDITVSNLKDMNGNVMASPVTWDVFVDRNPLQWVQQSIDEIKNINEGHSFVAEIHNRTGLRQSYEIVNLPDWLSVSPNEGSIDPLKNTTLTFSVHPGLNTGRYASAAYIQSDFGFEQALPINMRVLAPPPAWKVNSASFENSMFITAAVKIDNVASDDPYDMIAAFVGDECRGVANMQYVKSVDQYLAFLTVYSNAGSGETVNFKVWNAYQGVEHVEVDKSYTFSANAVHGTLTTPVTIDASGNVAQRIDIAAGWRWISFNKLADDLSLNSMLSNLTPAANDIIKSQTAFAQYDGSQWLGSLAAINNHDMYMIKLTKADSLRYSGDIINPLASPIAFASGWNWIGFTPSFNVEINEALANFEAATGDAIVSQNGFALYDENIGWDGNLTFLSPTSGYKLFATNTGSFTYPEKGMYLPSSTLAKAVTLPASVSTWTVTPEQYQYIMLITAVVDANNRDAGYDLVAAFKGDECRGVGYPKYSERLKKTLYFLQIHSNKPEHESLELRAFRSDGEQERIVTERIHFTSDQILGSLVKPLEFITRDLRAGDRGYVPKEFILTQNYPNPFNPTTKIGFGVPKDAHVTIAIYNIMGQEVIKLYDDDMKAGYRFVKWNSTDKAGRQLPSGMYFVKMHSGEFVKTRKMILLK
ncbi:T9SS type A sorting domain-containing protein [candidate division KSB1 bacterium]|nr:T9SS type A sorting domain-containing protein [candidate division KSB1 bacterium]